jgi:hypothetical protein
MSIKNILSNLLIEQDENLVTITPGQYLENLEDVGGIADRVAKLKPYKGKGIVINGDLNLRNFKNVGPLTGVVRIMGRLNINNTNVPNLNGITVDGYIDDYGSSMWKTKKQLEFNKKLAELDQKRKEDEWNIGNGDDDSIRTSALFDILKLNGEVGMTGDGEGNVEVSEDKYFIYPQGRGTYGYGKQYEWLGGDAGFDGILYDVYTEDEAHAASKSAVSNMIDDMGHEAFSSWVWDNSIDKVYWRRWLDEFYADMYYNDPEGHDVPLTLSTTQQAQVDKFKKSIEVLKTKLTTENLPEDQKNIILKKIEGFENIIEDIEEDPQGDYDEDYIQSLVDERVDEYENDINTFINDYGFDKDFIMDFVDLNKVTEEVVDADGYGVLLNSYDGEADYIRVGDEDYYIMRVS